MFENEERKIQPNRYCDDRDKSVEFIYLLIRNYETPICYIQNPIIDINYYAETGDTAEFHNF